MVGGFVWETIGLYVRVLCRAGAVGEVVGNGFIIFRAHEERSTLPTCPSPAWLTIPRWLQYKYLLGCKGFPSLHRSSGAPLRVLGAGGAVALVSASRIFVARSRGTLGSGGFRGSGVARVSWGLPITPPRSSRVPNRYCIASPASRALHREPCFACHTCWTNELLDWLEGARSRGPRVGRDL